MTTEVLRNMLYEGSSNIAQLSHVVMDEVHYLADRSRGAVWEEVIIHLPKDISVVALSATVSNAEEFGDWLRTVRGDTEVVVEEHRPIPLHQHVMAGHDMIDLFTDASRQKVSPELARIAHNDRQNARYGGRGRRFQSRYTPSRIDVIAELEREGLLPSITFIFSRAACNDAVTQCLAAGLSLNSREDQLKVRGLVDAQFPEASQEELRLLGFDTWRDGLERGIAAHHAGLLPAFKEVVELLFQQGLVKVVFATETLALGINMPAKSVVLEKLVKWNGTAHVAITPGEYTQLTGRAGRRGIDIEGHAIVVWHNELDPAALAGLASTRTYPLKSSFRPSYNMAINLISKVGTHKARELLESSFAQFQADKSIVGLATQIRRQEDAVTGFHDAGNCHLGDFDSYMELRKSLSILEKDAARDEVRARRFSAIAFLNDLSRGDVFAIAQGRKSTVPYVVLDEARDMDDPRPRVMSTNRVVKRVGYVDIGDDGVILGRINLPNTFDSRSPKTRNWLADEIIKVSRSAPKPVYEKQASSRDEVEISRLRKALRAHPCHGCNDREEHVRWYEQVKVARREIDRLESRVEQRTSSIARDFDRICAVLTHLGYLNEREGNHDVTPSGVVLGRIYGEMDLLTAECLQHRVWDGLSADQLAAAVSTLVFETRREGDGDLPNLPEGELGEAISSMIQSWGHVVDVESQNRVENMREMDLGFMWPTSRWARGQTLTRVLRNSDLQPGDFVRWTKQVIDVLGQIALASDDHDLSKTARNAADALERGIVAW